MIYKFRPPEVDDDDEDDDEMEAEAGYEDFVRESKQSRREDQGPSARDIEARRRHDEML